MTLTMSALEALRAELFADDVEIPAAATGWTIERATKYFESAGESEEPIKPSIYEVIAQHAFVNCRAEPSLSGAKIGQIQKGSRVTADARGGDGDLWIRLVDKHGPNKDQTAWLLTDGTHAGLGLLLRLVSGKLPPPIGLLNALQGSEKPAGAKEAWTSSSAAPSGGGGVAVLAAPLTYEIVYPYVKVRSHHATSEITPLSHMFSLYSLLYTHRCAPLPRRRRWRRASYAKVLY